MCKQRKPRGRVKLDLKTKNYVEWMLLLVSACSLALVCFSGPKTGSKQGPKSPPANSADYADRACHAIASLMRTRHSAFCLPRGRVVHASASLVLFQSARLCEPCGRVTAISSLSRSCDRVTSRWSSPQFLVFLPFLQASFPISNSFMPYKAWNT